MNTEQLNNYIKNYLENDKTNSAIMLTGAWGCGKSYYVKNKLIPYIDKDNEGKCVIISLYGIKDLKDISKSIYLEVRAKKLNEKNEGLSAGKLVAKTIFKGVTSFFGVDLKVDENDLQNLYNSIDLTNKLIILEDLERCSMDITEVLGFVNNLVEQDGVKVLLVAYEQEIFRTKLQDVSIQEKTIKDIKNKQSTTQETSSTQKEIKITEATLQEYKKIKEKTVSDTIVFYSPYEVAIEQIIKGFDNKYFNRFLEDKNEYGKVLIVKEIENEIMNKKGVENHNLRSFIFACQKTVDMFKLTDDNYDHEFLKHIFLSNIAFCLKLKVNENLKWNEKDKSLFSSDLATSKYPLYKISYDFIKFQYLDLEDFKNYNKLYVLTQNYERDKEKIGADLRCIYDFYLSKEEKVIKSVNNIYLQLKDKKIPLTEYGKLANYLIAIKSVIGQEELINKCKKEMIENLVIDDSKVEDRIMIHDSFGLEGVYAEELSSFEKEMMAKLKSTYRDSFDFDYTPDNLSDFCRFVYDNKDKFVSRGAFAVKLHIDKFAELIKKCSAEQIYDLREIFHTVYSFSNIDDFFMGDKDSLIELKDKIVQIEKDEEIFDKIQRLQVGYLISNLENYIERLSKE